MAGAREPGSDADDPAGNDRDRITNDNTDPEKLLSEIGCMAASPHLYTKDEIVQKLVDAGRLIGIMMTIEEMRQDADLLAAEPEGNA